MNLPFPSALALAAAAGIIPAAPAAPSATGGASTEAVLAPAALQPSAEAEVEAGAWRFSLTPYLWLTAQSGDTTVKGQTAEVDLDLGDAANLLDENFNGGLALHVEAGTGPVSIFGDVMYLDLETSGADPTGASRPSYTAGLFEFGVAYAVTGSPVGSAGSAGLTVEPLAGARIYYVDSAISGPAGNLQASDEKTWADAFVGARASLPLTGPMSLFARGDVGAGGSDLAWNVLAGVSFDFSRVLSLQAGYRWMDVDYSEGDANDRFAYNVMLEGPFVGLSFRF